MKERNYCVVTTRNPLTGECLTRPEICNRSKLNLDHIVDGALYAGYVRGQHEEVKGTLLGLLECMSDLLRNGYDLSVDGFFGVKAYLKGQTNSKGKFTDSVRYAIAMMPYWRFAVDVNEFKWTREQ